MFRNERRSTDSTDSSEAMIDTLAFVDLTRGFFGNTAEGPEADEEENNLTEALTLATLRNCLAKREWTSMRELLHSLGDTAAAEGVLSSGSAASELGMCPGSTFLHAVSSHNVPLDIARTAVELSPEMTSSRDSFDRTPLHVAVEQSNPKTGLGLGLVRFLLSRDPRAAEMRDHEGMTPLMRAVCLQLKRRASSTAAARRRDDGRWEIEARRLSIALVKLLALAAPRSVVIEDESECTALEHAIVLGAPKAVVSLLQKVTIDVRRGRSDAFDYEAWT